MKKNSTTTFFRSLSVMTLIAVALAQAALPVNYASAAQITTRSVTLVGAADGGSKASGVVNQKFDFTLPGSGSVGSVLFEYCTTSANANPGDSCVAPSGLSTSTVTLGAESGITGMSMSGRTANTFYLARTSAFTLGSPTTVSYTINGVTNPSDENKTFFIRLSAFSSLDATGSAVHSGSVAASTERPIILDGTMPESLVFCTGRTIGLASSVPDCTNTTSGSISFNQLFSPTDTATSTSQMAASTNAGSGYAITVNGTTLTSGSNTISGMAASDVSRRGVSQFGLNLKANTVATSTTPVGTEISPAANGSNYRGQAVPSSGYDAIDSFKFVPGEVVANSNGAGTDAQIYTVSYIANVPGSLPAGTYSTTLTYICTPTY